MKSRHHKLSSSSSRSSPKIKVSCLTSKVTRDHLMEIFSGFGNVISIEMICTEKSSHEVSLQSAYIDYETKAEASKAVKSMNGGKDVLIQQCRIFCV